MTNTPPQPEPDDPTQCSGEEGFCPEHGFHRHTLKQPGTADAKPADQAAVLREAADRGAVSATLWAAAEHHTVAEWICCDPINPDHPLCAQGGAALQMLQALLVDDPEAWKPAPLLDEVMRLLPTADQAETERLRAERDSLGREAERLRTDWTAMRDRAERAKADRDWWRDRAYAVQARAERADRAAVLREAADVAERLMDERYGPDCSYGVGGRDVARELRHHADEAQQQPAERPRCQHCGLPHDLTPSMELAYASIRASFSDHHADEAQQQPETEEERADREETERDHARGDHTYCGITCEVEMPTEHLRNFVIAKGYPGTKGALDELLRRAADAAQPQQEPPVHGESVAHLASLHDDEPATGAEHADTETVHACPPDGSGLTPCCGRTPFELPLGDRISSEAPTTCTGPTAGAGQDGAQQ